MKKNKLLVGLLTCLVATCSFANAGVQLDRSRVLIDNGSKSVAYAVTNHYESPVVASAVITNFDGTPSNAFAVSPSLYQIKANSTSQGQIVQLEQLPQDRESVFWLNVKTVIGQATGNQAAGNQDEKIIDNVNTGNFGISLAQRIKVFYRPKDLNENCATAVSKLSWKKSKEGIVVSNPSKVSVSVVKINSKAKEFNISDTLMPLSEKTLNVKIDKVDNITFTYVDEYGNFIEAPLKF